MNAQKINTNLLICHSHEIKSWYGQPYDPTVNTQIYTYKTNERTFNITSYTFMEDGNFLWNDNPSCGLNVNATNGQGTWTLENNILKMDFKNVVTEMRGKRGVEKYEVHSLTENEMVLKLLK